MNGSVPSAASSANRNHPIFLAICCVAIIGALVLGVGLKTGLVIRHIVQTLPLWVGVVAGIRRSRATGWIALPMFLFWSLLMTLIWLFLLGIAHIVSGTFSPIEVAMTIVVGLASIVGIVLFAHLKSELSAAAAGGLFILFAVAQFGSFWLSLLPSIAHR
jgi:hypothetical protein